MSRGRFNPKNVDDLPIEVVLELQGKKKGHNMLKKVEILFLDGGGTLNIDEVIVGLWRKYRDAKKRKTVTHILHRMKMRGFIQPTENTGEYTLVREVR